AESFGRRADGADDSRSHIRLAADPIAQFLSHRIEEQAVDSEIAAARVSHRIAEHYVIGMAAVVVIGFGAKGRDLKLVRAFDDYHHSEFSPDWDRASAAPFNLRGPRRRRELGIARLAAQQDIRRATST